MHQRVKRSRDEPVIDEDVLLDAERGVQPLEVTRSIARHAWPERQILRACRRANRIGLYECQFVDRACQRRRLAETARDRHVAELVESRRCRHLIERTSLSLSAEDLTRRWRHVAPLDLWVPDECSYVLDQARPRVTRILSREVG